MRLMNELIDFCKYLGLIALIIFLLLLIMVLFQSMIEIIKQNRAKKKFNKEFSSLVIEELKKQLEENKKDSE